MSFDQVLDAVANLSPDDQEALLHVLRQRRIERRRSELAKEIEEAEREFAAGKCESGTPADLMRKILS